MLGLLKALYECRMKNSIIPAFKPLITVAEARKLLGSDCKHMNDDQVQEVIVTLTLIAKNYLKSNSSNNSFGNDTIEL